MRVVVVAMVVVVVVEMVFIVTKISCAHNAINAINSNILIYFYPDEKRKLELMFSLLKVSPSQKTR